ncbi:MULTISPECIES: hypothetical protein [unclassified Streptomyces]|uniref:Uncharacterized protein n=1 Tax=Streptomyces johnsoniae TaxID=3075532 RepID=A0ABU2S9Q6_9ACTN|nr:MULTISPECIES: hypothetical protein [unclassified Streptomyces]MDT0444830.1 hypothetical protein [Streptomyces sp. DSM 41886]ONK15263.1 hypothetical protein STBA_60780 [Streptomyces sp. MP131-18]
MNIEWAVLGQVILVSVLLTVAVVGLFSLGIRAGSARSSARPAGYLCFSLCAAAVGYGIWIVAT